MASRANEIYPFKRNVEKELKAIRLDEYNGQDIIRYYHQRLAEGISFARIHKCLADLRRLSSMFGKAFRDATKDDIVELFGQVEAKDLSAWTKRDYKVVFKHFYKWLRNWEDGTPPEIRWIRNLGDADNRYPILPKDLLTTDEQKRMLNATMNLRDKALLEVMFESGRRPEEILTLHIQDIEFDAMGAKLYVNGKMGEDFARIISSAPSLAVWLDNHPLRNNQDSPVWCGIGHSNKNKQLSYSSARGVIRKIAKRAGIQKKIKLYLFRHTRIDETQGLLTEAQQCMMFGWKFGSRMPHIYMKRYGKHIDNAQAIMNGVVPQKKGVTSNIGVKACLRCHMDNSPASKFCNRCGNALDMQTALQVDESRQVVEALLDRLTKDPKKMEKLLELVREK